MNSTLFPGTVSAINFALSPRARRKKGRSGFIREGDGVAVSAGLNVFPVKNPAGREAEFLLFDLA